MKYTLFLITAILYYPALFYCPNIVSKSWSYYRNKYSSPEGAIDSAHYWVLKPYLDPQEDNVRTDPTNYDDAGIINPPSGDDPCNTGYVQLCGIYVIPDPAKKNQPYFSRSVNADIYQALKKNEFLEGKVFYKDL